MVSEHAIQTQEEAQRQAVRFRQLIADLKAEVLGHLGASVESRGHLTSGMGQVTAHLL